MDPQNQVVDVSGALANENLELTGHDEASGLPLVRTQSGQIGTFNPREYARTKYGQDIPENVQFQYNSASNPVQASPESLGSRVILENFYDDKSKIAALTQKYGEVIPDKTHGLVVNNKGIYQAYDPKFLNTMNPRELAEGFVQQLPKMVGAAAATAATVALTGNPVGLAAIGGTALAAGLESGAVRTSLGRLMGTYNATPEEQAQDIGLEGLVNMAGAYIPIGAKGGWGVVAQAMGVIKNKASDAVKGASAALFGKLTGAGESATSTLMENAPGVIRTMGNTLKDAGGNVKEGVNLATQRAADTARNWLEQGVKALPAQFKAGLEEAATQAESKNVKIDVYNLITKTKHSINELNFGKFADEMANPLAPSQGKVTTKFRPLSETEKTTLGVADPAPGAMDQIQRIAKLLGRYQNDGELTGKAAFNRLANLNKELNQIKYGMSQDATPEFQRAVNQTIAAFKTNLGQEFADQGLGDAWIAANKPYLQYSKSVDQARDLLNSKEGIYTFLDRIGGKAGKMKSAFGIANDINALTGQSGEALYDQMLLHQASSKFMKWQPHLGLANVGLTGYAAGHANVPLAAATLAGSSPRLVANAVNVGGAPARGMESAQKAILPYMEKFQDMLRRASPDERKILLENPAYITGAYKVMQQSIHSIGQQTQGLMQGAQTQIQNAQSGQQNGPGR